MERDVNEAPDVNLFDFINPNEEFLDIEAANMQENTQDFNSILCCSQEFNRGVPPVRYGKWTS